MFSELTEKQMKEVLFNVYSAGYEAGYWQVSDLATAYNIFWNDLMDALKKETGELKYV